MSGTPPALMAWNTEKTYLRTFAATGVLLPQTAWFDRGEPVRPCGHVERPRMGSRRRQARRFPQRRGARS